MPLVSLVRRVGDLVRVNVSIDGRVLLNLEMAVAEENQIGLDAVDQKPVELYNLDETEFVSFELPTGLPWGYAVLVFYKREKGIVTVFGCALFGPGGFIDAYPNSDDAVFAAIAHIKASLGNEVSTLSNRRFFAAVGKRRTPCSTSRLRTS